MLNRNKVYFLLFFLILLLVFFIDYKSKDLFKIYKIAIYRDGVYLFVALATILSILAAYFHWQFELNFKRKSDINGLLEELRHNVNIVGNLFVTFNSKEFYQYIFEEIDKMDKNKIYPNPTDSTERRDQLLRLITYNNEIVHGDLMPLRSNFIDNAISSQNIFALSNNRIFLNLGHLSYSIKRHNFYVNHFNSDPNPFPDVNEFKTIQNEYALWLHFRLHFMLADLVINTDSRYFIDKEYVQNIIKHKAT